MKIEIDKSEAKIYSLALSITIFIVFIICFFSKNMEDPMQKELGQLKKQLNQLEQLSDRLNQIESDIKNLYFQLETHLSFHKNVKLIK